MMKNYILLCFVFFIIFSCKNQKQQTKNNSFIDNKEEVSILTKNDTIQILVKEFENYLTKKDSLSEVNFLKYFPHNFTEFVVVYGYKEINNEVLYGPLYNKRDHIINFMPKYSSKKGYISKLINIGINGYWQSDNVSHLQNKLLSYFFEDSLIFMSVLNQLTAEEICSLWSFLLDGVSEGGKEELKSEILSRLNKINYDEKVYFDCNI